MNKGLRLATTMLAAVTIPFGTAAVIGAGASSPTPGTAEADSYGLYAQAWVTPLHLGLQEKLPGGDIRVNVPTQDSPPALSVEKDSGTIAENFGYSPGLGSLVHYVDVNYATGRATLTPVPNPDCAGPDQTPPPGFYGSSPNDPPLTGSNACAAIAQAGLLDTATGPPAKDVVTTGVVVAQSTTQSCTATPTGNAVIAHLELNGTVIIGQGGTLSSVPINPAPNTTLTVLTPQFGLVTLILNEQIYDNKGHGMTVNAVHVFTQSLLNTLVDADVILAHAHSEMFCGDGSTTDTGLLPPVGGTMIGGGAFTPTRPVVTKTDNTKHANRGETVTYTVKIAQAAGCKITSVTDVLPPGFHLGTASGDLGTGTSPAPIGSTPVGVTPSQDSIWFNNGGGEYGTTPDPLVETITATIDAAEPAGLYVNNIFGTSTCGEFAGSDLLGLFTGPPANQGPNPGIIVPRPGGAASPTPSAVPSASPTPTPTPIVLPPAPSPLPNTAMGGSYPGAADAGNPATYALPMAPFSGSPERPQAFLGLALIALGTIALVLRILMDPRTQRARA